MPQLSILTKTVRLTPRQIDTILYALNLYILEVKSKGLENIDAKPLVGPSLTVTEADSLQKSLCMDLYRPLEVPA